MSNPVKKLKLNRETVRALNVKTSLRTGDQVNGSVNPSPSESCPTGGCPIHHSLNANCAGDNNLTQLANAGNVKQAAGG